MKKLQIAIDGPASAGKSTVAKLIAKKYNYLYLDTGAMYRVITLMALRNNLDLNNERIIMDKIVDHTDISFKVGEDDQLVFANNEDVTLAGASNAFIIGFNVRPTATAKSKLKPMA